MTKLNQDDDDQILKDGQTLRVPQFMMDSTSTLDKLQQVIMAAQRAASTPMLPDHWQPRMRIANGEPNYTKARQTARGCVAKPAAARTNAGKDGDRFKDQRRTIRSKRRPS
jgi:hypothetical protein